MPLTVRADGISGTVFARNGIPRAVRYGYAGIGPTIKLDNGMVRAAGHRHWFLVSTLRYHVTVISLT